MRLKLTDILCSGFSDSAAGTICVRCLEEQKGVRKGGGEIIDGIVWGTLNCTPCNSNGTNRSRKTRGRRSIQLLQVYFAQNNLFIRVHFFPPKLLMLLLRRLKQYRNKWTRLLGIKSKILTVMSKLVRHAGCTLCFLVRCKERASLSFWWLWHKGHRRASGMVSSGFS